MNKTKLTDEQDAALEKVAQQFTVWRETRTKRERIPDSFWSGAVDLFRCYGLSINKGSCRVLGSYLIITSMSE